MDTLVSFFSFSEPGVLSVTLGVMLLTASSATVGTFTVLRQRSLVGDAVAHAVLPGICLAFLVAKTKEPAVLIPGAALTGWLSLASIDGITRFSKLKEDTAIAVVLSVFFGIGILLLTMIQQGGFADQSGLDGFLFGRAAALVGRDLVVFAVIAVVLVASVVLFFKEFQLLAFDPQMAEAAGLPVRSLRALLTVLTVLAVVTGIQAVGVVLMAAMLITPAAAARYWTGNVARMTALAAGLGALSGLAGAYVSYAAPRMPTGPWIVLVISLIAMVSFILSPRRGVLARALKQWRIRRHILDENVLKELVHLGEADDRPTSPRTEAAIQTERSFPPADLRSTLRRLRRQGFVRRTAEGWSLTAEGLRKGRRVVKLHRLWELYLERYMNIAPDHVHEDAETIEHVITPELEAELVARLDHPDQDPHHRTIPY